MSILEIVLHPDPVLRETCVDVTDINDNIRTLLSNMAETMYNAPGIGLAAPQVGELFRVIVVDVGIEEEEERKNNLFKIINPIIVAEEGTTQTEEGCLSIPDVTDTVKRSAFVKVEGFDENGDPLSIEADGLLAVCLQHEIDHLNGILFFDHLSRLKRELLKKKYKKILAEMGR